MSDFFLVGRFFDDWGREALPDGKGRAVYDSAGSLGGHRVFPSVWARRGCRGVRQGREAGNFHAWDRATGQCVSMRAGSVRRGPRAVHQLETCARSARRRLLPRSRPPGGEGVLFASARAPPSPCRSLSFCAQGSASRSRAARVGVIRRLSTARIRRATSARTAGGARNRSFKPCSTRVQNQALR